MVKSLFIFLVVFCVCFARRHSHHRFKEVRVRAPFVSVDSWKIRGHSRDCDDDDDDNDCSINVDRQPSLVHQATNSGFRLSGHVERCPVEEDECICVEKSLCQRGYIKSNPSSIIERRGKRGVGVNVDIGGFLRSFGVGVDIGSGSCDECFRTKTVDVEAPFVDVKVEKDWKRKSDCGRDSCVDNRRKETKVVVVKESRESTGDCVNCGGRSKPRPLPEPPLVSVDHKICPRNEVCCRPQRANLDKSSNTCGIRRICGVDRKTGLATRKGDSHLGEWPWQALILKQLNDGSKVFLCNGVIIDDSRVLTAAQCIYGIKDIESLEIRLGEWDIESDVEIYPHESYAIQELHIHPNFDNGTLFNDIAVLKLDAQIQMNKHVSPICIPDPEERFSNDGCFVTGWNKNDPLLRESKVRCITDEDCEERIRPRLGPYFKLDGSFICGLQMEACQIEGGGPLVCKRKKDNSYALVGLMSWAPEKFCRKNAPEVYVRVQNFIDWIYGAKNEDNEFVRS